jgi:hypothetical protein
VGSCEYCNELVGCYKKRRMSGLAEVLVDSQGQHRGINVCVGRRRPSIGLN